MSLFLASPRYRSYSNACCNDREVLPDYPWITPSSRFLVDSRFQVLQSAIKNMSIVQLTQNVISELMIIKNEMGRKLIKNLFEILMWNFTDTFQKYRQRFLKNLGRNSLKIIRKKFWCILTRNSLKISKETLQNSCQNLCKNLLENSTKIH